MTTVIVVVVGMLSVAAVLSVLRLLRGPSVLDRVVAMDMLLAIIVCGLGATAAFTRDSSTVPVLVVVSLLGFIGSVSVARFVGRETVPHAVVGPGPAQAAGRASAPEVTPEPVAEDDDDDDR